MRNAIYFAACLSLFDFSSLFLVVFSSCLDDRSFKSGQWIFKKTHFRLHFDGSEKRGNLEFREYGVVITVVFSGKPSCYFRQVQFSVFVHFSFNHEFRNTVERTQMKFFIFFVFSFFVLWWKDYNAERNLFKSKALFGCVKKEDNFFENNHFEARNRNGFNEFWRKDPFFLRKYFPFYAVNARDQ